MSFLLDGKGHDISSLASWHVTPNWVSSDLVLHDISVAQWDQVRDMILIRLLVPVQYFYFVEYIRW